MSIHLGSTPVARLDFVGEGAPAPGWYIRYVIDGRPRSERLPIEVGADAFGAVELAAAQLGCTAEEIAVGGPVWPQPLDGMVDADGTLEFVADDMPSLTEREGEWRLLGKGGAPIRVDARRYARRSVDGLYLRLPAPGKIMNWSEFGMGVEICRPLRVETRVLFEAQGKKSKMELFGEVRWCSIVEGQSLASEARYRAGIDLIS